MLCSQVGIFDADVYGPSLPTMVSPELRILRMNPETRAITPTEYQGVQLVSFGFAGQGSAIMRGAMVSGLIQQMLTTSEWGETLEVTQQLCAAAALAFPVASPADASRCNSLHALHLHTACFLSIVTIPVLLTLPPPFIPVFDAGDLDYLVVDFPPGTGDIQLTLCQSVAFSAAVVVTTPQKLAFVDVAKGVRMFAKLAVPVVSVVENMSYFDGDDGKRYRPFGKGSGQRVQEDFGIPNLVQFPIVPDLSAAGDSE
jgi:Mrp family chromosome partitioning ATPase